MNLSEVALTTSLDDLKNSTVFLNTQLFQKKEALIREFAHTYTYSKKTVKIFITVIINKVFNLYNGS